MPGELFYRLDSQRPSGQQAHLVWRLFESRALTLSNRLIQDSSVAACQSKRGRGKCSLAISNNIQNGTVSKEWLHSFHPQPLSPLGTCCIARHTWQRTIKSFKNFNKWLAENLTVGKHYNRSMTAEQGFWTRACRVKRYY
jgi:hypothetical protein